MVYDLSTIVLGEVEFQEITVVHCVSGGSWDSRRYGGDRCRRRCVTFG